MFEKEHINLVFIYVLVFLQLPSTCAYVPMPVNKRPVFRVMKYGKHYSCLTRGMLGQAYRGMSDTGRGRAQAQLPDLGLNQLPPCHQVYNQQNDTESSKELVILQQGCFVISSI